MCREPPQALRKQRHSLVLGILARLGLRAGFKLHRVVWCLNLHLYLGICNGFIDSLHIDAFQITTKCI